jgi:DNA-binding CsgD family transcriptional regulator
MTIEFPEPRWAVPGIVPEGLSLLCGAPKLGKSWFALNLAVAIGAGSPALGRFDVEQGDVLYLALEDTGRRLKSRLRIVLADQPAPERLTLETVCESLTDGGMDRIEAWLDDNPDARLIIVDVFTRVRGRVSDRANRYEADYDSMALLKGLSDRYGVAVLVVHHTRKATAEDFLDRVSGTQGIAGAADAVLLLSRGRGSAEAVLHVTGRDIEEAERALNFEARTGTWQLLDGPASQYGLAETRRRILHLVREGEEAKSPTQIAEALAIKPDNAKKTVRRMVDDGQLATDGAGHYFAPQSPVTLVTQSPDGDSGDWGDSTTHDRAVEMLVRMFDSEIIEETNR